MSAFPESGRSDQGNLRNLGGRFRPEAAAERDDQTTAPEGSCNPDCFIVQFTVFPPGMGLGTMQAGSVSWNSDGSPVDGATATIKRVDVDGDNEIVVISIDTRL
jgi:hypothetical protein